MPDAIPIAGLSDDLAVLLYVIHRIWGNVSDDIKLKAKDKLSKWFDNDEIKAVDHLFDDDPTDTPV